MARQQGGNRKRRFARVRKAYDETRMNDQHRPRRDEPPMMDDRDWLDETKRRYRDQEAED